MSENPAAAQLTRRGFIGASLAAPLSVATIEPAQASGSRAVEPGGDAYLQTAREAARWIRSARVDKSDRAPWAPEPDHPEKAVTVGPDNTIYSGSAGIVLFLLELAQATGDESYLHDASLGADYLAATWKRLPNQEGGSPLRDGGLSFDQGVAGVAFTLSEAWKATQNVQYRNAALAATQELVSRARPAGGGLEWLPSPAVGQGGGIVLYLLEAATTFHDERLLQVAQRAGTRILELGQPDARGGTRWQGLAPQGTGSTLPANTYFPNFELGTAGVAFVLARLYEVTRQPEFLEAAKAGARHIQAIATVTGDSALVYYREPDLEHLYYLGYCHGPAGTARLFYQLYKVTGESTYLQWTEKLAQGIVRSGVPEKLTPGYWNVACQCCGAAAVTELFLSLWATTGRTRYRDFARRVADQLISRGNDLDGKGYRWYQAWTRVKPWEVNAETGYKIGAAGIGAALLHTHSALGNRYSALLLPDNPFPRSRGPA